MPAVPDITITMPLDQLQSMTTLLATHPFNQVAEMMATINQQARQQLQALPQPMMQRPNGEARVASEG